MGETVARGATVPPKLQIWSEREREKLRNAHGALPATVTAQHTEVATVSKDTEIDHVKRTWTDPHVHALGAAGHTWDRQTRPTDPLKGKAGTLNLQSTSRRLNGIEILNVTTSNFQQLEGVVRRQHVNILSIVAGKDVNIQYQ